MRSAVKALQFVVFLLIPFAIFSSYHLYTVHVEDTKQVLQGLIDSNISDNKIGVSHVELPSFFTLLFESQYGGYFTISSKNDTVLTEECSYTTVDFWVRKIGDQKSFISISAQNMLKLRKCN
jgi:hypothetical protein